MDKTEKVLSPEMGATGELGADSPAGAQPHEKEDFERAKELAWDFMEWANQYLDDAVDWTPKLTELCEEYDFVLVDEEFLVRYFAISEETAEHFLYWFRNWESNLEGSDGGFEILYSPRTGLFYALIGSWWRGSGEYHISVQKYTPDELREIIDP